MDFKNMTKEEKLQAIQDSYNKAIKDNLVPKLGQSQWVDPSSNGGSVDAEKNASALMNYRIANKVDPSTGMPYTPAPAAPRQDISGQGMSPEEEQKELLKMKMQMLQNASNTGRFGQ